MFLVADSFRISRQLARPVLFWRLHLHGAIGVDKLIHDLANRLLSRPNSPGSCHWKRISKKPVFKIKDILLAINPRHSYHNILVHFNFVCLCSFVRLYVCVSVCVGALLCFSLDKYLPFSPCLISRLFFPCQFYLLFDIW